MIGCVIKGCDHSNNELKVRYSNVCLSLDHYLYKTKCLCIYKTVLA